MKGSGFKAGASEFARLQRAAEVMPKEDWPVFQVMFEYGPKDLTVTTWCGPVHRHEGPPQVLLVPAYRDGWAFLPSLFRSDGPVVENAVQTHVYRRVGPSVHDSTLWVYEWDERNSEATIAHDEGAGL